MNAIIKQGHCVFAAAIVAFGVENVICAHLHQAMMPVIPWVPGNPLLSYLTGAALLVAGLSIAFNVRARLAAILLGILFLLCVVLLQISRVAALPLDVGVRTCAFETLAMCGSALTLAGTLSAEGRDFDRWEGAACRLTESGRFLFAISAVVFGIDHFLVLDFIASLVPSWIPGSGMFWAYFTGAAFIAAGIGIATKWMGRWAGFLLGIMFLLWFLFLHAPRVVSFPRSHDPDEWSSAFIALAMCGGSWICAWALSAMGPPRSSEPERH
jgi:uncharacterized membrane protein